MKFPAPVLKQPERSPDRKEDATSEPDEKKGLETIKPPPKPDPIPQETDDAGSESEAD